MDHATGCAPINEYPLYFICGTLRVKNSSTVLTPNTDAPNTDDMPNTDAFLEKKVNAKY